MNRLPEERPFRGKNLCGLKFGWLTVAGLSHYVRYNVKRGGRWIVSMRFPMWICLCKCGKTTIVNGDSLKRGTTLSCGCFATKQRSERLTTHGESNTMLYQRWSGMITRCTNPNRDFWPNYGGKGISVCEKWKSYEGFASDMRASFKPELTIERRDPNLGYYLENCYWGTPLQQANNKTTSKMVELDGKRQTVADWARETGINVFTLYSRLGILGWDTKRALTTINGG